MKKEPETLSYYCDDNIRSKTKPLSDEEIIDIWFAIPNGTLKARTIDFARAIEERHGIK